MHPQPQPLDLSAWQPGPPPCVPEWAVRIDRQTARRWRCQCGHRGLIFAARHLGTEYRAAGVCPHCGHCEEL